MTRPALQPLDVVVVDGLWYMPHHPPIMWRGLDRAVHCLTVVNQRGDGISPEFSGLKIRNVDHYRGRRITIHRYRYRRPGDPARLMCWLTDTWQAADGYDFRQWFGFITGILARRTVDDRKHWTCAELPYWLYQANDHRLTPRDEVLPMPRLFRYHPHFETVFDGVWQ